MERTDPGGARAPATTGVLVRRLLGGVVLAVAAFFLTHRVLLAFNGDDLVTTAAGAAAALAAGGLALWRAVAPVVAIQADLQVRYEGPGRCAADAHRVWAITSLPRGARPAGRCGAAIDFH